MYDRKRLVQSVEEPLRADNLREMMPVQIGPQIRSHVRDRKADALPCEKSLELADGARCRVIDMSDRSAVYYEPPERRRRLNY